MHQVRGGVHMDVGVLGLPHWDSTHCMQLLHGGGLGEKVQKKINKGREPGSGVPFTNSWTKPSPQGKSCSRGCANQFEWTGTGSRDAAQATTSTTVRAPELYVASSVR